MSWNPEKAMLVLVAGLTLMGGSALAAGVNVLFEWDSCPQVGEWGVGMDEAVEYHIWQSRNGGPEELVGVTADTLFVMEVLPGGTIQIRVQGVDAHGTHSVKSEWSDPLYFESDAGGAPRAAYLKPSFPNPFNPETTLSYLVPDDLGVGEPLVLEVFDVRGTRVRSLVVDRNPGWHEVRWDGRNDEGSKEASGTYLTRYMAGSMVETGKMVMLK